MLNGGWVWNNGGCVFGNGCLVCDNGACVWCGIEASVGGNGCWVFIWVDSKSGGKSNKPCLNKGTQATLFY